ncbi:MAG: helix-turn-helix domain-containing protein [Vicinamibacterales bacterium]
MGAYELAVVGLVGSGVGAALGAPLLWAGPHRRDIRLLGAALLLTAAVAALISARLAGLVPASAAVGHAVNVLGLVAMPLGVAYVRFAAGSLRPLHPALLAPLAAYAGVAAVRATLTGASDIPFGWVLPLVLGLTGVAALTVRQGPPHRTGLVPPEWVVGFMALLNVAQIARMDLGHLPFVRAIVPLVVLTGVVALAAFVTWRQATSGDAWPVPVGPPAGPRARTETATTGPPPGEAVTPRYERSTLDEAAAADLRARVDRALDADRLFARPDLTLGLLAGAAGSTPHLVSEVLNRFGGTSFRDVVTRRRVDDVKAQLGDPANDRFTIEGIGASAGFGSRSALYEAFRRCEGTTPTAYRDRCRRRA